MCEIWTLDFTKSCSPKVLSISVNGTIILSSIFKTAADSVSFVPKVDSKSAHFSPLLPSSFQSVSALTCVTKSTLMWSRWLHSSLLSPTTVHSPESSQSDLLNRNFHPLHEALSTAAHCSGRNTLLTSANKSCLRICWLDLLSDPSCYQPSCHTLPPP